MLLFNHGIYFDLFLMVQMVNYNLYEFDEERRQRFFCEILVRQS